MPNQGQRRKKSSSSLPQTALHRQMSCSAGCENVSEAKARPGRKRPEVDQSVLIDATEQVANAETHLGAGTNVAKRHAISHQASPQGQVTADARQVRTSSTFQQEGSRSRGVLI